MSEIIGESELDFGQSGTAILRTTSEDAIPQEAFGFTIATYFGVYPPDSPQSHRRAIYARLTPQTDELRRKLKNIGKSEILAWVPLTSDGIREVRRDPNCSVAEHAALAAVMEAGKLAKAVADA
jgi:hypothetical protein